MQTYPSPLARATGIALIVLPLLALALKFVSFGWMTVFLLFGPIFVMAVAYAVQIVLAVQCFFVKRDLLGGARMRATTVAWVSVIGMVLLGITMPDGGDAASGSTLQIWLGAYGENGAAVHAATDTLTVILALVSVIAWVVGWAWLMVEWIGAHARIRRAQLGLG